MKAAVMTGSTSYLSQDLIDKYSIRIASLSVTFDDGKNFTESNGIAIEEFYSKMASSQTVPTTSQPAIDGQIIKYETLRDQGHTDIIAICLLSGISGSHQSSHQAGGMIGDVNVHASNSKLTAMTEGCYVLRITEMVEEGHKPQQTIDNLANMCKHIGAHLIAGDLKNLQKSGRITGAQAQVGTLLKVKPVLKLEDDKIMPEEKIRTKKRTIQTLKRKILDIVKDFKEVILFVINGDHFEDGQALYKKLQDDCSSAYQVAYSEFGPVVVAHLGSGGLGSGYVGGKIRLA